MSSPQPAATQPIFTLRCPRTLPSRLTSMPDPNLQWSIESSVLRRRGFLSRLGTTAAALGAVWIPAGSGAQRAAEHTDSAPGKQPVVRHELDKWLDALTGVHRQVYDLVTPVGS